MFSATVKTVGMDFSFACFTAESPKAINYRHNCFFFVYKFLYLSPSLNDLFTLVFSETTRGVCSFCLCTLRYSCSILLGKIESFGSQLNCFNNSPETNTIITLYNTCTVVVTVVAVLTDHLS